MSGQKPRLTKEGKTIICKMDNFVPLVVPGLSTSFGCSSSSTSTLQDLSSTSPAQERSDGPAPGDWYGSPSETHNKNRKRDGNRDSDDRLRDLPEWLEEFADNLEDTEVHAPAALRKWHQNQGSTVCFLTSQKRPKLRSLLANQNDKGSLQKTHWRSSTSSSKVW